MRSVIRNGQITEAEDMDIDVELPSSNAFFSTHINQIPLQNAVSAPRLFYGARFYNQAVPLKNPEAPLVQALVHGSDDRTFDEEFGERLGAVFSPSRARVLNVTPDEIELEDEDTGEKRVMELYNNFVFNRKTGLHNASMVNAGDIVEPGQLLARSNYTDDRGRAALGLNARVGLVPYKGYSMDDAVVISESFAKRLTSQQMYSEDVEYDQHSRGGLGHFTSVFPTEYTKEQLQHMDENGVAKPGTILKQGDPYVLLTRPRMFTSNEGAMGKLSRAMRTSRQNASLTWTHDEPAVVVDVANTRKGRKVVLQSETPAKVSDKLVARHGQKGIISKILPDEHMPRTTDGEPLEVLLNPLGMPSRVNNATIYDMLLGKVAKKTGKEFRLPGFNKPGEKWYDYVQSTLDELGISDKEEVFDPMDQRKLENPVTVGNAYFLKLHHMGEDKASMRGQGSYDCYSDDTEVLTDRGWVLWPDVTRRDMLYTPDFNTGNASYELPSRLVSYDYEGDMLEYDSRKLNWLVTPNHKFASATPKVREWRPRTAEKMMSLVTSYIPKFGFPVPQSDPEYKIIPHHPASRKRSKYAGDLRIKFLDYVRLAAWWASEGSVDEKGRLTIWQMPDAHPEESAEIFKLLVDITGKQPNTFADRGWRINDTRIGAYFHAYGEDCYTKRLPEDLLHMSPEACRVFIDTYVKGDGHLAQTKKKDGREKTNITMCVGSSSPYLIEALQIMSIHAGIGMQYFVSKEAGTQSVLPNGKTYTMREDHYEGCFYLSNTRAQVVGKLGDRDTRYKGEWNKVPYKGKVYCATTRTGWLMIRRKGKVCISGNSDAQPLKGGSDAAQAKRLSTLELNALLASGAYATMREGSTVRGQKNDEYWRAIRQGHTPKEPGSPFVWDKFKALLIGSGMLAKDVGGGNLRLGPFTDAALDKMNPAELKTGGMVNPNTLEPDPGGLFDPALVGAGRWARIRLSEPMPNPAFEKQIALLLGIREKDVEAILVGEKTIEEAREA